MPLLLIHPLAKGDGVVPFLFVVVWILIIIVSTIQKWQEAQRKRRYREQQMQRPPLPAPSSPAPPPVPNPQPALRLPPLPPKPPAPAPHPQRMQAKPQFKPQHKVAKPKAPVPIAPKLPHPPVTAAAEPQAPEPEMDNASARRMTVEIGLRRAGTSEGGRHASPRANLLAKSLRPRSLRQQYLLTEILREPLGLRAPETRV